MRRLLLAACLLAFAPSAAGAATLVFPSDAPVARITIPDDWKPEETASGIQASSPDNVVYLSVDVADGTSAETVVGEAIDFLAKENNVTIDASTQAESDWELNGMSASTLLYDGGDEAGPATIGIVLVAPSKDTLLVVTYWGSKDGEDEIAGQMGDIMQSLKPAR